MHCACVSALTRSFRILRALQKKPNICFQYLSISLQALSQIYRSPKSVCTVSKRKKTNINYFDFQIKEGLTDKEITKITVWILLRCFPFTHFSLTMWSTLKGGRHFCFENPAKSLGPISNRSRPFESVTK